MTTPGVSTTRAVMITGGIVRAPGSIIIAHSVVRTAAIVIAGGIITAVGIVIT